jgi:hypothetical protein
MTQDNGTATITMDTITTTDITAGLVISLVALLRSSPPIMWCKEHLRNFSIVERVHDFSLVRYYNS